MNKEIVKFLLKEGFEDQGGDEYGEAYDDNKHISVFVYKKKKGASLCFAHSLSGYYEILNADIDQIELVIDIFKKAEFITVETLPPSRGFKLAVVSILKDFVENKGKSDDKWSC
jgi:hypothetical protein